MPTQEYKLDATGTNRVQIFQERSGEGCTVLLNKSIIGSISNQEDLTAGQAFTLKDGSVLTVRLVNNHYQVMRNGQLLLPMSGAEIAAAEAMAAEQGKRASVPMPYGSQDPFPPQGPSSTVLYPPQQPSISPPYPPQSPAPPEYPKMGPSTQVVQRNSQAQIASKGIYIQKFAYMIALGGGLIALIAFFAMPYVTIFAKARSLFTSQVNTLNLAPTGSQLGSSDAIYWLTPIMIAVAAAIAATQIFKDSSVPLSRTPASLLVVAGVVCIVVQFVLKSTIDEGTLLLNNSNNPFLNMINFSLAINFATGFWVTIAGMAVAVVGGLLATGVVSRPSKSSG